MMNSNKKKSTNGIISFIYCLTFIFFIPLLPLLIEFFANNHNISTKSVVLAGSMFSMGIGVGSQWQLFFILGLVISVCEAFMYGFVLQADNSAVNTVVIIASTIMIVVHLGERVYRHIYKKQPFYSFGLVNY